MSAFGADYDRWLESDKDRRDAEWDAYVSWCEDNDLDPDDDNEAAWEDYVDAMSEPDPDDMRDQEREMRELDLFDAHWE